jgi:ATP-dependent DNA helicase RecG
MASSAHPLAPLLGPLRYAARGDFANLRSLKDLRTPLAAAIERSRAVLEPERRQRLERALVTIDGVSDAGRRSAVLEVLAVLRDEGLSADFVPAAVAPSAAPPVARAPKGAKTPRAPKEKPAPDANQEAMRMLSIAPVSGPLATPLKLVGWRLSPRLVGLLNKRGIVKVGDVLFLLPRVYEDRRQLKKIAGLRAGERGTVIVEVRAIDEPQGRGRRQFRAILGDATGTIAASYFQGGPWLKAKFPYGKRLVVSGEVRQSPCAASRCRTPRSSRPTTCRGVAGALQPHRARLPGLRAARAAGAA